MEWVLKRQVYFDAGIKKAKELENCSPIKIRNDIKLKC